MREGHEWHPTENCMGPAYHSHKRSGRGVRSKVPNTYDNEGSKTRAGWEDLQSRRCSVFTQHVVKLRNSLLRDIEDGRQSRKKLMNTWKQDITLLKMSLSQAELQRHTPLWWDMHQSSKEPELQPAWDSSAKMGIATWHTQFSTSKHHLSRHPQKQATSI